MFSGLRTEGGISNHYLITTPLDLCPYQRDVIYIKETTDEYLNYLKKEDLGLTLIDFHRFLATRETPLALPLVVSVNGELIEISDAKSAQAFEHRFLGTLNPVEFKRLLFRDVDSLQPKTCRH